MHSDEHFQALHAAYSIFARPQRALARFVSWGTESTHSTHNKADTDQKCLLALRHAEKLTCRQILAHPASAALSLIPHRFRTAALPVLRSLRTPGLEKCADSARDLHLIRQVCQSHHRSTATAHPRPLLVATQDPTSSVQGTPSQFSTPRTHRPNTSQHSTLTPNPDRLLYSFIMLLFML